MVGSDRPSAKAGSAEIWKLEEKLRDLNDTELQTLHAPSSGWHKVLQVSCSSGISHLLLVDPPRVPDTEEGVWGLVADSKLLRYTQPGAVTVENRVRDAVDLFTLEFRHHNWSEFGGSAKKRRNTANIASYALSVFESVILGGDKWWPGASLLCAGCLCDYQKQSVNVYTFTYYCFVLASIKNITVVPNRFKGSRICFQQAQAELLDEELRPRILSVLHETLQAEWTPSDTKVLKDIIASTMQNAKYVVEDSDTLFEGSKPLLQLRDDVLRANKTRAEACLPEVKAAWRHFAGKGRLELDANLNDVVEGSSTGPEYRVFLWRKDDGERAKRYVNQGQAVDRAERHVDDILSAVKLLSLLGHNTPTVKKWRGKDEWIRTTQWRAVENEDAVPADRKPCEDG